MRPSPGDVYLPPFGSKEHMMGPVNRFRMEEIYRLQVRRLQCDFLPVRDGGGCEVSPLPWRCSCPGCQVAHWRVVPSLHLLYNQIKKSFVFFPFDKIQVCFIFLDLHTVLQYTKLR